MKAAVSQHHEMTNEQINPPPILNEDHVLNYRDNLGGDFGTICNLYFETLEQEVGKLVAAGSPEERMVCRSTAHRAKGSSAALGFTALAAFFEEIEQAPGGVAQFSDEKRERLESLVASTKQELERNGVMH